MRLPVRTALLQNSFGHPVVLARVRLPVRTALLQNISPWLAIGSWCDYQSERHCSKTNLRRDKTLNRAITSQNGTAPKRPICHALSDLCAITSQNGTAPKPKTKSEGARKVRLPVRTALLQNMERQRRLSSRVRLPVRTALLQNVASNVAAAR